MSEYHPDIIAAMTLCLGGLVGYRRVRLPSKAALYRAVGTLALRAAAWVDLECQARADYHDAGTKAYRERKGKK